MGLALARLKRIAKPTRIPATEDFNYFPRPICGVIINYQNFPLNGLRHHRQSRALKSLRQALATIVSTKDDSYLQCFALRLGREKTANASDANRPIRTRIMSPPRLSSPGNAGVKHHKNVRTRHFAVNRGPLLQIRFESSLQWPPGKTVTLPALSLPCPFSI